MTPCCYTETSSHSINTFVGRHLREVVSQATCSLWMILGWIITDQKLSEDSKNVLSGLRLSACFNLHIPSEALVLPAQAPCPWCRFCAGLPERICHPSAFCFLSRGRGKAYWKPWLSCFLKTQRMHLPPSPVYIKTHRTYDFLTDRITRSVFFFFTYHRLGEQSRKYHSLQTIFHVKLTLFLYLMCFHCQNSCFFVTLFHFVS